MKIITTTIELDIRRFYGNKLEDEYFYMSKYYKIYFEKKLKPDKNQIDIVRKNIPLNYFIIKFSKENKDILDIIPSFNVVKKIIEKKSKNFASILYQSKYYEELDNKSEQGNILQKAIEEKLRNEHSLLLNYTEKTLLFELDFLIPSSKNIQSEKKDLVEEYYKAKMNNRNIKDNDEQDILSYMTEIEKKDMEKLSLLFSKEKEKYQNIILFEKNAFAKNYDLAIIRFTSKNSFAIILFQMTVSREKSKFRDVNIRIGKDTLYIIDKIEKYFKGYKSQTFHIIYVLDKDENLNNIIKVKEKKNNKSTKEENNIIEKIDYKNGLDKYLTDKVHLLFFGRKYLKFMTEEGKIVKELSFKNDDIEFITSDKNHYFLDEYIQKIFNKVIELFSIEIGKLYVDNYDFCDMVGDCLIITKINNSFVTVVVNINGKKLHMIEVNDNIMKQIPKETTYNDKESYIFEIVNPNAIIPISLFQQVDINK